MRKREKVENTSKKPNNTTKKKIIPKKIKSTPESRLSDLEKTLDINIQILKTFYQSSTPLNNKTNSSKEESTIKAIENIKTMYNKKKELFNKLKQKKSKSLIEIQIFSEKKRKLEEIKNLYQEKLEENEEGLYNKDENIKKVEKRLKEVEIYIHKLTLNMLDKNRQKYYQDFTIKDFLEINNDVSRQNYLLKKKNGEIKLELKNTLNENKQLKMKNGENKNDKDENKIEEEKNEQEEKIKKLTQKYENKIEFINSKKNLLKNALEKMNQQFHLFNINKLIKKSNKSINIYSGKEEENKNNNNYFKKVNVSKRNNKRNSGKKILDTEDSFINRGKYNDDIKINSFLDFSVLNNKEDEINISKERSGILKNSIWDVSAINVKDISIIEKKDGI
jgi:hypothetical protein